MNRNGIGVLDALTVFAFIIGVYSFVAAIQNLEETVFKQRIQNKF